MLVQQYLEDSALRLPDKTALICGKKRLTYKQINDSANRLAAALVNMGIKRQDRIVIFLDNSPEAVISLFGILKAGAVFIILNPQMKAKKLNYILKDSGRDDLIKTGGERVSPKELENTLYSMEGIAEVAVIGVPDEILGSALKAFVVTNDRAVTEQSVLRYCKENLEDFMVPKYVEFKDSLPKLDTGKIDKKRLVQ